MIKVNDWVYSDFELVQVKRMENGNVVEVTDGIFNRSYGLGFTYFPLTLKIKRTSEEFKAWYDRLRQYPSANIRSIHNLLETWWVELCEVVGNTKVYNKKFKELQTHCNQLERKLQNIEGERMFGIKIAK